MTDPISLQCVVPPVGQCVDQCMVDDAPAPEPVDAYVGDRKIDDDVLLGAVVLGLGLGRWTAPWRAERNWDSAIRALDKGRFEVAERDFAKAAELYEYAEEHRVERTIEDIKYGGIYNPIQAGRARTMADYAKGRLALKDGNYAEAFSAFKTAILSIRTMLGSGRPPFDLDAKMLQDLRKAPHSYIVSLLEAKKINEARLALINLQENLGEFDIDMTGLRERVAYAVHRGSSGPVEREKAAALYEHAAKEFGRLGRYAQETDSYRRAAEMHHSDGRMVLEFRAYQHMAAAYIKAGELAEANAVYGAMFEIVARMDTAGYLDIDHRLQVIEDGFRQVGDEAKAENVRQIIMAGQEAEGPAVDASGFGAFDYFFELAEIESANKRFSSAREYYRHAGTSVAGDRKIRMMKEVAKTYSKDGQIFFAEEKYDLARNSFALAIEGYRKIDASALSADDLGFYTHSLSLEVEARSLNSRVDELAVETALELAQKFRESGDLWRESKLSIHLIRAEVFYTKSLQQYALIEAELPTYPAGGGEWMKNLLEGQLATLQAMENMFWREAWDGEFAHIDDVRKHLTESALRFKGQARDVSARLEEVKIQITEFMLGKTMAEHLGGALKRWHDGAIDLPEFIRISAEWYDGDEARVAEEIRRGRGPMWGEIVKAFDGNREVLFRVRVEAVRWKQGGGKLRGGK